VKQLFADVWATAFGSLAAAMGGRHNRLGRKITEPEVTWKSRHDKDARNRVQSLSWSRSSSCVDRPELGALLILGETDFDIVAEGGSEVAPHLARPDPDAGAPVHLRYKFSLRPRSE